MPGNSGSYWDYFGGAAQQEEEEYENERPDAEHVFADTFEDLLRPEVHRVIPLWTWTGAAAGAALGFVSFPFPSVFLFPRPFSPLVLSFHSIVILQISSQ